MSAKKTQPASKFRKVRSLTVAEIASIKTGLPGGLARADGSVWSAVLGLVNGPHARLFSDSDALWAEHHDLENAIHTHCGQKLFNRHEAAQWEIETRLVLVAFAAGWIARGQQAESILTGEVPAEATSEEAKVDDPTPLDEETEYHRTRGNLSLLIRHAEVERFSDAEIGGALDGEGWGALEDLLRDVAKVIDQMHLQITRFENREFDRKQNGAAV